LNRPIGEWFSGREMNRHLNGILFIDRMRVVIKNELVPKLAELQARTKASLKPSGHQRKNRYES